MKQDTVSIHSLEFYVCVEARQPVTENGPPLQVEVCR